MNRNTSIAMLLVTLLAVPEQALIWRIGRTAASRILVTSSAQIWANLA